MLFHQIFMNVYDITNINSVIINRKIAHISIQSIFFFSCDHVINCLKYFQCVRSGYGFISETFTMN